MLLVNSFDMEPWWCTVPPVYGNSQWNSLPSVGEDAVLRYADACDTLGVKCTFFSVAWYATHSPNLLRELVSRGHEIGCHGYYHEDMGLLTLEQFSRCLFDARRALEDVVGVPVISFRSPSFTLPRFRWSDIFGVISKAGFDVDSSVCTATRVYGGGFPSSTFSAPRTLEEFGCDLFEIPVVGSRLFFGKLMLTGGGYLRLTPRSLLNASIKLDDYQVLYTHPHDYLDDLPDFPDSSFFSRFRRRARCGDTLEKVTSLLRSSTVRSCGQLFSDFRAGIYYV